MNEYETFPDYRAMEYNEEEIRATENKLNKIMDYPLEKLQRLVDESKAIREKTIYGFLK